MANLVLDLDEKAFFEAVKKYVDLSPVFKEWQDVRTLKWPDALVPPKLWTTMKELNELIAAVCAAVELAKDNFIKEIDPDGTKGAKVRKELALATAVTLIATYIRFGGLMGPVANALWKPLINVLVSLYVSQQPPSWVTIALTILKLTA